MNSASHRPTDRVASATASTARPLLDEQQRRRREEITQLTEHLSEARAAAGMTTGEIGGVHIDVELLENQLATAHRALLEIDAALERVADGTYGVCAGCGRQIAPERLEVIPEARMCVLCQDRTRRRR